MASVDRADGYNEPKTGSTFAEGGVGARPKTPQQGALEEGAPEGGRPEGGLTPLERDLITTPKPPPKSSKPIPKPSQNLLKIYPSSKP